MKLHSHPTSVAALLALAGLADAQTLPLRRGPFAVDAHTFSLAGSGPGVAGPLFKPVGDQTSTPSAQVLPVGYTGPDYSLAAMFPGYDQWVEVDAISSGNDYLPIDVNGQLDPPPNRWAAMIVSVTNAAQGAPGGWVQQRVASGQTPGADLLSYIFEGSSGLPEPMIAETFLEQARENIGLAPGADIDALDWFLPLLAMNDGEAGGLLFLNEDLVFLSLTSASASLLNAHGYTLAGGAFSGADVLRLHWNGASWDTPVLEFSHTALALDSAQDVDALAYNLPDSMLIFSTVFEPATPSIPQLQVFDPGWPAPLELKRNNGLAVPIALELGPLDDVDSVCGIDPESSVYSTWLSIPHSFDDPRRVGLSISRDETSPGRPTSGHFQVTGWGGLSPSNGSYVEIWASLDMGLSWAPLVRLPRQASEFAFETSLPFPDPQPIVYAPTPGVPVPPPGAPGIEVRFAARLLGPGGSSAFSGVQAMRL